MRAAEIASVLKGKKSGAGWIASCVAHEDTKPSMSISEGERGPVFFCHAGCSQDAVLAQLIDRGLWNEVNDIPKTHAQLGAYTSHWDYHSASGEHVLRVCRWERDGGKEIRPLSLQNGRWAWKQFEKHRPLYRLSELIRRAKDRVLIVEGEKTCDAAAQMFPDYVSVTWCGGAKAIAKTDWQSLRNRDVTLLADHDIPGESAMDAIGSVLQGHGCLVRRVDLAKFGPLPKGWDCADALNDASSDLQALWEVIEGATPIGSRLPAPIDAVDEAVKPIDPPPLTLLWFAAMGAATQRKQLIKGLIVAGSLFVVYGESNSGKSFFVIDLSLSVAAGIPWRGQRVQKGLVIYVALEGASSVQNRIAAARKVRSELPAEMPFAVVAGAFNLLDDSSVADLITTIKTAEAQSGEQIALVIIDTLARALAGADENSSTDMGAAVAAGDRVRTETGAAVGFIHHCGKDGSKGARGSSALRAAVDTEILIEGQAGTRSATVTKQRDLDSGQSFAFDLQSIEIGHDDDGPITSCVVTPVDAASSSARRPPTSKNNSQAFAVLSAMPDDVMTLKQVRDALRATLPDRRRRDESITWLQANGWLTSTIGGLRVER